MSKSISGEDTFVEPTKPTEWIEEREEEHERSRFFLVFERETSWVFRLPPHGRVVLGRSRDADLRLVHRSVSKRHAMIEVEGPLVHIVDLDSRNGTRLNGRRIEGSVAVNEGDVVAVSSVTLVLRGSDGNAAPRGPVTPADFRRRAAEELDRAQRYHRSLTLATISFTNSASRERVEGAVDSTIRPMDSFTWQAGPDLLVLMPELTADDAFAVVGRLRETIAGVETIGYLGFATFPTDACDLESLIAESRSRPLATAGDSSGSIRRPYRTFEIADTPVIVADSCMQRVYTLVKQLAGSSLPVLVHGETGTGKELVATAIHQWSERKSGPFVAVNCAALPDSLVDAELFGYERGSFTGATTSRPGIFERAHGGTIFLDEIGELSPTSQAKLLRVLESKKVRRLGGSRDLELDFRLVSATNRDLEEEVSSNRFRRDLLYRLSAATVWLAPLRERPNELSVLAQLFLEEACRAAGRPPKIFSQEALDQVEMYGWPGNVRELRHMMEYLASAVVGAKIESAHLGDRLRTSQPLATARLARGRSNRPSEFRPIYEEIAEFERRCMLDALRETRGNVTRAAALIKMPLRTFQAKMKQLGLAPPENRRRKDPARARDPGDPGDTLG